MQTIWKTQGKSPFLAHNAFDIIIWSDFAFTRLFLDSSKDTNEITRQVRSSLRFARALYEASTTGKIRLNDIYTKMAFQYQTDKEFSVNGKTTVKYIKSKRTYRPSVETLALKDIILNGGEKLLSPERRFDQTIYFTVARVYYEMVAEKSQLYLK